MPCNHKDACSDSKALCKQIFEALNQKITGLELKAGKHYCAIHGRRAFAYIGHSKKQAHLNIWFLGFPERLSDFPSLAIKQRSTTQGTWEDFKGSFGVENTQQLNQAVELLAKVS